MQRRFAVLAVALAGACPPTSPTSPQAAAQPVVPQAAPSPAAAASTSPEPARLAIATPNTGNGWIEIVITESPSPCGAYQPFPESCEPAWRVRIELPPEQQQPGQYRLGPDLLPFAYRDAQGKAGGVWEAGKACKNLGSNVVGTLRIMAIDADGISGVLHGAGEADGPFRAQRCASCKGTGEACSSNAECCADFCHAGRCQP